MWATGTINEGSYGWKLQVDKLRPRKENKYII